jgi:hypothetical protein
LLQHGIPYSPFPPHFGYIWPSSGSLTKRDDIEASALFKPLERQEPTRLSSPPFACALRFQGARPRCLRKSCRLFSSETPRQASWAAQQPAENSTTVWCHLAPNPSTLHGQDMHLVSYSQGALEYHHGGWVTRGRFKFYVPPSFTFNTPRTQYFSNHRYKTDPQSFGDCPFAANETDPLHLTITSPHHLGWGLLFGVDTVAKVGFHTTLYATM